MAKLIRTIEVNLGDIVYFKPLGSRGEILSGRVQDISEFPDIYVETGNPKKDYKRYRISLNMIEENLSNRNWSVDCCEFEQHEPLEFVYNEDLETTRIIMMKKEEKLQYIKEKIFEAARRMVMIDWEITETGSNSETLKKERDDCYAEVVWRTQDYENILNDVSDELNYKDYE